MKNTAMQYKKVLFFGSYLPEEIKDEINKQSIGLRSNANDLFQKNIIKGLLENNCQVFKVTIPNIGSFPKRYKKIWSPNLETNDTISFKFLNISGIKQICHIYSLLKYIFQNKESIEKLNLVIIYDLSSPFLFILPILKYVHPTVNICAIIPDLPEFAGETLGSGVMSYINKYLYKFTKKNIDYFSLITSAMRDKLSISVEKSIVIEGLYDPKMRQNEFLDKRTNNKLIIYSGSLDKRNGIINLVEAFEKMSYENKELHIYGDGPLKDYCMKSSEKNNRIFYCGQIESSEIINKYPIASLLINPRLPTGIFTKYSFPSKTIEYLASGVPVIMYNLEGVPNEYMNYVTVPNDLSSDCLAQTMDNCLISDQATRKLAERAKSFILNDKTYKKQVSKLLNFIFEQPGFDYDKP